MFFLRSKIYIYHLKINASENKNIIESVDKYSYSLLDFFKILLLLKTNHAFWYPSFVSWVGHLCGQWQVEIK